MAIMEKNVCLTCGGDLELRGLKLVCVCCGNIYAANTPSDIIQKINAIRNLRIIHDFKSAEVLCENGLADCFDNYEMNWQMFLAENKVCYVRDPKTNETKPTLYGDEFSRDCVLNNPYLRDALDNAPNDGRAFMQKQAELIEGIRLEYCEKMAKAKTEPYHIFISFKSTESITTDTGEKLDVDTKDKKLAHEIYTVFNELGYRVFFSPISIGEANREGEKFEPSIFAALVSCKAFILVGTKSEYVKSGWVKNEWTRYLYFAEQNRNSKLKKLPDSLFYVFNDGVPKGLPTEIGEIEGFDRADRKFFDNLRAKVCAKIGSPRRGGFERIKIDGKRGKKAERSDVDTLKTQEMGFGNLAVRKAKIVGNVKVRNFSELGAIAPLDVNDQQSLSMGFGELEKGLFAKALPRFENILRKSPNADAMLGRMFASVKARNDASFIEHAEKFKNFKWFDEAIECATVEQAERIAHIFAEACRRCFEQKGIKEAIAYFDVISAYNTAERYRVFNIAKVAIIDSIEEGSESNARLIYENFIKKIDEDDIDLYIKENLGFVPYSLKSNMIEFATLINNNVLAVDDSNDTALFNKLLIDVKVKDEDDLERRLLDLQDSNLIVEVLKKSSRTSAERIVGILLRAVDIGFTNIDEQIQYAETLSKSKLKQEQLNKATSVIKKIIGLAKQVGVFAFDERAKFMNDLTNFIFHHNELISDVMLTDTIDFVRGTFSSDDIDAHVEILYRAGNFRRKQGRFSEALAYYKKALELDEGDVDCLWACFCTELKVKDTDELSSAMPRFMDKKFSAYKKLETIFQYVSEENLTEKQDSIEPVGARNEIINRLACAMIEGANTFKSLNDLGQAYCDLIKLIDVNWRRFSIQKLMDLAQFMQSSGRFDLAEKYYHMILAENGKESLAYWGLLQSKYHCKDDADLIICKKLVENTTEYENASGSTDKFSRYIDVVAKQNMFKKRKKLRTYYQNECTLEESTRKDVIDLNSDELEILMDLRKKEVKDNVSSSNQIGVRRAFNEMRTLFDTLFILALAIVNFCLLSNPQLILSRMSIAVYVGICIVIVLIFTILLIMRLKNYWRKTLICLLIATLLLSQGFILFNRDKIMARAKASIVENGYSVVQYDDVK